MIRFRKNVELLCLVFIMSGLLVSCMNSETISPTIARIDITTSTPSMTIETQKTHTPEVTITETPRPTNTFTATRIPTLSKEASIEYIESLYKNNGGCDLPCWWGIMPGESDVNDLENLLSPLDRPRISHGEDFSIYAYAFEVPLIPPLDTVPDFPYMEPDFIIENEIVTFIKLNSLWVSQVFDYSLQGFLREFGAPSEIWIEPHVYDWESPYYYIDLVYSEVGMIVSANDYFFIEGKEISLCLDALTIGSFPASLVLFSPQEGFTFIDYHKIFYGSLPEATGVYQLEELTFGYTGIDFHEQFRESSDNNCVPMNEEAFVTIE